MINTAIIENEEKDSNYLIGLLQTHFPELTIVGLAQSVPDGVQLINEKNPQLIFLDVELAPYTGFDLLERTNQYNYEVIFTTSFNKYATRAFRYCALDFIPKPFGLEELKESITRYKQQVATGSKKNIDALVYNYKQSDIQRFKVGLPVMGGLDFYVSADIIMCQSSDNYCWIYLTESRKILVTKTLKWVEEFFRDHQFIRVHDSYLINPRHIAKYKRGGEGGVVELSEGHEADVSRRRKDDFLSLLAKLGMIR